MAEAPFFWIQLIVWNILEIQRKDPLESFDLEVLDHNEDNILDNKPFPPFQSIDNAGMEVLFRFPNPKNNKN